MLLARVDPSAEQSGPRRKREQNADHAPPESEVASLRTPSCCRVLECSGCEHQPDEAHRETEDATHVEILLQGRKRTLRAVENVSAGEGQATVRLLSLHKIYVRPAPPRATGPSPEAQEAETLSGNVRIVG